MPTTCVCRPRKPVPAGVQQSPGRCQMAGLRAGFRGVRGRPSLAAASTKPAVARLRADTGIVRHRLKIRATINNAKHFVETAATHGSWHIWLHSLRPLPYAERQTLLHRGLTHCGPNTIFYFLLEAGEATPGDRPKGVK